MSKEASAVREPLLRILRRNSISAWQAWLIRGASLILALLSSSLLIYSLTKLNPLEVYGSMFDGVFGNKMRTWNTFKDIVFLLCISVGLAPAFKMKFWNIGAEGQVLVGGISTAACMIYFANLPTPLLFVCMIVTSMLSGAVWGLIPAFFKANFGTNETLFTLMMNYVAIQLTSFFVSKWENPFGSNTVGIINAISKSGWFPSVGGQKYGLNVIIVLSLTFIMYIYLKYTKQGYEISVVGESVNTARYAGINVKKAILRTMLISGAVCGLAGFVAVSGASHTISVDTAGGRGFTAIIVAWLSKFNTPVMILVSLLIVFLENGAAEIATDFGLNEHASEIISGIILFFILGSEFFINYKLVFRTKHKEVTE